MIRRRRLGRARNVWPRIRIGAARMGYAKLFSSITESSLWCEPKEVRLLFVSMLAKADATGFVEAAIPGLAKLSNLTLEEVEEAIISLENPDPHSKNPDFEGRRILKVPGGWLLLNYESYRARQDRDRKEYMREYMKNHRDKQRIPPNGKNVSRKLAGVSRSPFASASASVVNKKEEEVPLTSEAFAVAWKGWQDHRREIKKALTPTQITKQLKHLAKLGEPRSLAAIEWSISQGYQGIFEPSVNGKSK